MAFVLAAAGPARAQVYDDAAAAIVMYPYVVVDSAAGIDTSIQLSNVATDGSIEVHCVVENANRHCSLDPEKVCAADGDCVPGTCDPGWTQADFSLTLARRQPLSWQAGHGVTPQPPLFQTVPPLPDPFVGALRCFARSNTLAGAATVETFQAGAAFDAASYAAVGVPAQTGDADGDQHLVLADAGEFNGCPNINLIPHFFNGAVEPVRKASRVETAFVLLPCSVDYDQGIPGAVDATYLVHNEYGQSYASTVSIQGNGPSIRTMTEIDAALFDVGFQGTLTGQTRLRGTTGGLVVLALERHVDLDDPTTVHSAARAAHQLGLRPTPDVIVLPEGALPPLQSPTPTPTDGPVQTPTDTPPPLPTATPTLMPPVRILIGRGCAQPGDSVDVTVSLETLHTGVVATTNDILFDPRFLTIDAADCRLRPGLDKTLTATLLRAGQMRLSIAAQPSIAPIAAGPLYVCTVHIAPGTFPKFYTLNNAATAAFDVAGSPIAVQQAGNGSIDVSLVGEPGDVNADCNVDQLDLSELIHQLFIATPRHQADVNRDQRISAADVAKWPGF